MGRGLDQLTRVVVIWDSFVGGMKTSWISRFICPKQVKVSQSNFGVIFCVQIHILNVFFQMS